MNDLISRQAALEAMDTWDKFGCDPDGKLVRHDDDKHYVPYVHYDDMVHVIKTLPSAQPERKKGRWKVTPVYIKCSECGESFMLIPQNYCPNCGSYNGEEYEK